MLAALIKTLGIQEEINLIKPIKMNVNKFHHICGHTHIHKTKATATMLGFQLTGKWI